VFAPNRAALHFLQERFRTHAIEREYVALVEGRPPTRGPSTRPRAPARSAAQRREGGESGRRAVTRFRALERLPDATLVSIRPETGRTHQIRVHFSAAGHPVLGDRVYGPRENPRAPRQMLHARRLGFPQPTNGEEVSAEAPLPEDFEKVLARLRAQEKKRPGTAGPHEKPRERKATRER
jgi:23S rRNA pseudouridine1911/1915/1917 synthase